MICKYFLPRHWLPFQSIDGVLQWAKVFKFYVVPFMVFTFAVFAFGIMLYVWYVFTEMLTYHKLTVYTIQCGFWCIHKVVQSSSLSRLRIFHHPGWESWTLQAVTSQFSPPPSPWKPLIYFPSLWICLLWTFHVNGIIQYVAFYLASFTEHHVFKVHPCFGMSFTTFYGWIIFNCLARVHFLYPSSVVGHLSCFCSLGSYE